MFAKKREIKIKQKRLIVNADDFGLHSAINSGVIEAFKRGIVTNTSLLVCGKAFDEAVELSRKNIELGVGVHLALTYESSVLSGDWIRSLLDEDKSSFLDFSSFLKRFLSGKIILNQVYLEFKAQIEKFIKTGLKPTHIDSHQHVHMIPAIFEILLELTKEFGIAHIRLSKTGLNHILRSRIGFRTMAALGLSTLANIQWYKIKRHGLNAPDRCYGMIESGSLDATRLSAILRGLSSGTSELVCHPGFGADSLSERYRWGYSWVTELKTLTNQVTKDMVNNLGIRLIRYNEI